MRGINKVALGISLAALSLTAGNAMAQAEETPADTPIAVLRTAHDTVNNIAHHDGSTHPIITIEHHDTDHKDSTKHAPLPPREILDFLTQSLNLAGRDILAGATKHTSANHTGTDSDDTTGISENEYRAIIGSTVAGALAGTPHRCSSRRTTRGVRRRHSRIRCWPSRRKTSRQHYRYSRRSYLRSTPHHAILRTIRSSTSCPPRHPPRYCY